MSKQSIIIIGIILILIIMFGVFKNIFSNKNQSQLENTVKEGAFLVDVRSPSEFADGHVKGSANIPVDQIERNLGKFKGKAQIVVFCKSGMRSAQAKSILERNDFKNVTNGGNWKTIDALSSK